MQLQELKEIDMSVNWLGPTGRTYLLAHFATSTQIKDQELQNNVRQTYQDIMYVLQAIHHLNMTSEQLFEQFDLPVEQKQILKKYNIDLNFFGGLGAVGDEPDPSDPVNNPEAISKVQNMVALFSTIAIAAGAIMGPTIEHIKNIETIRIEEYKLKQRDRELDQKDRELDQRQEEIDMSKNN